MKMAALLRSMTRLSPLTIVQRVSRTREVVARSQDIGVNSRTYPVPGVTCQSRNDDAPVPVNDIHDREEFLVGPPDIFVLCWECDDGFPDRHCSDS